ncbi:MAG: hypothetical protein A2784_02390 [Candidatus Chisholmbacteria bacterium RIFCSPHIGHO2_01_FULL_48_12]|uniref:Glycosyltransferase RgtA/B/C/D-like domain-containing protein n=1 Tax=Candidatus Chisholmbacteria bacterium RIFCSPHIGHO2_01_FULL_48_12 TaxID=1797589 RepID=A0A1G1VU81_9BACT|nr:MAG: hypothetical protein A2784_02390 [Candidatus Chisholmbacteria bacterium RIFCSPHIGHO2_01_FULL_48_12]
MRLLVKYEGLIILLAVTVLLRLPSLFEPYWYGDEQIYLAIGQGVRKGLVLYRDITDYPNKPPLIYLLAAAAGSVFWFKFMLMMWNAVHVLVVNILLKKLWGDKKWIVWGGSGAFILLTALPALEGNIANGEMFMIMLTTAAMLLLWKGQYFLAGILFALGFLFKIPVAADIAAAGLIFWICRHNLRGIISFGLGLGLPIAVVLGVWYGVGVAPIDLVKNMLGSSKYVTNYPLAPRLILVSGITGGLYLIKKRIGPKMVLGVVWLMWALFGATLSGRPYPHYFIQIVVPVIVTGGAMLAGREKRLRVVVGGVGLALVTLTLVTLKVKPYPVGAYYANFGKWMMGQKSWSEYAAAFDRRMPRNYELAYYLKTHTGPEEKIYIWGNQPDVYVMAGRLPVGRLVTSFHVEDLQAYGATMEWLKNDPPAYVVIMADEARQFEELKYWVDQDYVETDTISEAKVYKKL